MARFVLRGLILTHLTGSMLTNLSGSVLNNLPSLSLKKILIAAACVLASASGQTPALAQHGGGHVGGGGHFGGGGRRGAPAFAPLSRPRVFAGPRGGSTRGRGGRPPLARRRPPGCRCPAGRVCATRV